MLCPFPWGELGAHLTRCRLGRGLPPQLHQGYRQTWQTDRQTDRTVVPYSI